MNHVFLSPTEMLQKVTHHDICEASHSVPMGLKYTGVMAPSSCCFKVVSVTWYSFQRQCFSSYFRIMSSISAADTVDMIAGIVPGFEGMVKSHPECALYASAERVRVSKPCLLLPSVLLIDVAFVFSATCCLESAL